MADVMCRAGQLPVDNAAPSALSALEAGGRARLHVGLLLAACLSATPASTQQADGEALFRQRCASCHSLKTGRTSIGPPLAAVLGRRAGSVPEARYSPALQGSGIVWTEQSLSRFLANPRAMVPDTRMTIALPDARQRAAIIDYLKSRRNDQETRP